MEPKPQSHCKLSEHSKLRIIEEFESVGGYFPAKVHKNLVDRGFKMHLTTVIRFYARYCETKSIARKPGSGRPNKLTPAVLSYIQTKMQNPNYGEETTIKELHKGLTSHGLEIGLSTVNRGRLTTGWEYKETAYCQAIRPKNVILRYQWAQRMKAEVEAGYDFGDVIFTDETKVEVGTHRTKTCRRKGVEIKKAPKHKHPLSVLAWGGISKKGTTRLVTFTGLMDAEFYVEEVLTKGLIPSANSMYGQGKYKLMQDNDPKHTSKRAKQFFEENQINWWKTPAESPDINPIEWLWKDLKWYLWSIYKPETQEELLRGMQEYWETRVTPALCEKYIDGMKNKVLPKIIEKQGRPSGL